MRRKSKNFKELLKKFDQEGANFEVGQGGGDQQRGRAEGGAEKNCNDEDPHQSVQWDNFDDVHVRSLASQNIAKKWELLKMCREVIDENDIMIESMNVKESMKENISWQDLERKRYNDWKAKNITYMCLKKHKQKEKVAHLNFSVKRRGEEKKKKCGKWK